MANVLTREVGWYIHNAPDIERKLVNEVMEQCATCDEAIDALRRAQDEMYAVPARLYCLADLDEVGITDLSIETRDARGANHFISYCKVDAEMSEHDVEEPAWGTHIRKWLSERLPGCRVDWAVSARER